MTAEEGLLSGRTCEDGVEKSFIRTTQTHTSVSFMKHNWQCRNQDKFLLDKSTTELRKVTTKEK